MPELIDSKKNSLLSVNPRQKPLPLVTLENKEHLLLSNFLYVK